MSKTTTKPYDVVFMEKRIDKLVKFINDIKAQEKSEANRALVIRAKENLHTLRLWVKDRLKLEPTIVKEKEDQYIHEMLLNYETSQAFGRIFRKGQPAKVEFHFNLVDKFSPMLERMFPKLHPHQEKIMEALKNGSIERQIVLGESSRGWGKKAFNTMVVDEIEGNEPVVWPLSYLHKRINPLLRNQPTAKEPTKAEIVKGMVEGSKKLRKAVDELAKCAAGTVAFINSFTQKLAQVDPTTLISAGLASYATDPDDEQPGSSVIQFNL